jgi:TRAP-type C4-dicarboxylate transport system substrate-binding protein
MQNAQSSAPNPRPANPPSRRFPALGVRTSCFVLLVLALLLAASAPASAATTRIKLATVAPTGSAYHKSLLKLRDEWRQLSNGSVDLVIYADGKLGGESDTVGLMSVNSLQAAMLTAVGLGGIEKGVEGLQSIPMGFHSLDEVDYVGAKLQPLLEERLIKKGFVVLAWSDAGWVRFFSKEPLRTPGDLKKMKLFAWSGNPELLDLYKSSGFRPVPLETADVVPGLQTGLIDALPSVPVFALATQIDSRAPHMLNLNWAPLVGAVVVRKETWEKLPADLRPKLLEATRAIGKDIRDAGRKESDEAVKAMEKRGLKVTQVTPELEAEWRKAAEAAYPQIRGKIVPEDIFDRALELIKEYQSKAAPPK